jgi:hypothetical protein
MPEQIAMLDRVLKGWCDERGHKPRSDEAERQARNLVNWVEFGITDEDELASLIRDDFSIAK